MQKSKSERFARFGIATKGFSYCLLGLLIITAILGWGGEKAGLSQMLQFFADSLWGKAILLIIAVGFSGYVFWRLFQAFIDREQNGMDLSGISNRLSYLSSAIFYGALTFSALKIFLNTGAGSEKGLKKVVQLLLEQPMGQWLVAALATIFLGNAIFQLYIAFSGNYRKEIEVDELSDKDQRKLLRLGFVGFFARGITIGLISYLLFLASYRASSQKAGGTEDAFVFLQRVFGTWALAGIAIGLFAFGVFLLVKAFYRRIYIK